MSTAPRLPLNQGGAFGIVDQLLRDRALFRASIESERDLLDVARAMIITILVSAGIFGAALGAYRGGIQVLFAAIKLPLVVLFTAGLATPALTAFGRVVCGKASLKEDIALVLSALALGSLIIAALAPIMLLLIFFAAEYHQIILATVGCCGIGGIAGLVFFLKGLADRGFRGAGIVAAAALLAFLSVGTQMSWTLRPYLVRPRAESAPFLREREGSFLDSVLRSSDSARGVYQRSEAPLPSPMETSRE